MSTRRKSAPPPNSPMNRSVDTVRQFDFGQKKQEMVDDELNSSSTSEVKSEVKSNEAKPTEEAVKHSSDIPTPYSRDGSHLMLMAFCRLTHSSCSSIPLVR